MLLLDIQICWCLKGGLTSGSFSILLTPPKMDAKSLPYLSISSLGEYWSGERFGTHFWRCQPK